ncbi:MAG: hypothetical protein ACKOTZ_06555 [Chloroflexota bacterium]
MVVRPARRSRALLAALVALGVAGIVPAAPVAAGTAPSASAWVVVRDPGRTTPYTPRRADRSTTGGSGIVVTRVAPGWWIVDLPGLDPLEANYGHPQVSPMGTAPRTCWVEDWTGTGSWMRVGVRCALPSAPGTGADSRFVLTWVRDTYSPVLFPTFAYLWNSDAGSSGTPSSLYQHNAAGGLLASVVRSAPGRWFFTFPGIENARIVTVTPYGDAADCSVVGWSPTIGGDTEAEVACRATDGSGAIDRQANVFVGAAVPTTGFGRHGVTLWASAPTSSRYVPAAAYRWSSSGKAPRIVRNARGAYTVYLRGQRPGGAAIVTPYGVAARHCQVGDIPRTSPARVVVRCFRQNGSPADAPFVLAWSGARIGIS